MATYQVNTTAPQEAALAWLLALQQAADPVTAPADKTALLNDLVNDRLQAVRRQHISATATPADLKARLDNATPEQIERIKQALGL